MFGSIFCFSDRYHRKKDGSVKLALESRELNKQMHKNKYQMPNIKKLVDTIGQLISEKKQGDMYFTTMDLTYAYGQLPLSAETSVLCNFLLVGGRSTGTYQFRTEFYGLTSMPAEFQRVMDSISKEFPQANAFIDDILVTTKETEVEHISLVEKVLRKFNRENISLKLTNCEFAKRECESLGHRIKETWVTPLKRKTSPIDALTYPKTVTQFKPFMGSIQLKCQLPQGHSSARRTSITGPRSAKMSFKAINWGSQTLSN